MNEKTYVLIGHFSNENVGVFDEFDIIAVGNDKNALAKKADELLETDLRESPRDHSDDEILSLNDADCLNTNNDILYLTGRAEPHGFSAYHDVYAVLAPLDQNA